MLHFELQRALRVYRRLAVSLENQIRRQNLFQYYFQIWDHFCLLTFLRSILKRNPCHNQIHSLMLLVECSMLNVPRQIADNVSDYD